MTAVKNQKGELSSTPFTAPIADVLRMVEGGGDVSLPSNVSWHVELWC